MSQPTNKAAADQSNANTAKPSLLCKTFTEQAAGAYIDPLWILLQLTQKGITYTPQTPMGMQARAIVNEDVKLFIANYYKANGVDIETDDEAAKTINTWYESAFVRTSPQVAYQSGLITQERLQELMAAVGFGFGGGMGMGMGGFGGGMNMGGMMGGFGGGMGMGAAMPMWNKKTDAKATNAQQQQAQFNPLAMGGMGMMGGFPQMGGFSGMGGGFPQMGGMGMNMGFPQMGGMNMGFPQMGGFPGMGGGV